MHEALHAREKLIVPQPLYSSRIQRVPHVFIRWIYQHSGFSPTEHNTGTVRKLPRVCLSCRSCILIQRERERERERDEDHRAVCFEANDQIYSGQLINGPSCPTPSTLDPQLSGSGADLPVPLQVNATDADAGRNRILSYAIPEGADQGMVAIHPSTGVIRAHGSFDYEKEPIYEFPVIAIDRGDPARTGTAVLRVTVQDQNDEPPEFVRNSYSFEIEENRAAHSFVGVVSATDKDAHPYDVIKYSIDPFYGGLDAFRIDPDTGEITTVKILDREVQEMYELVVVATNEGYPQMRSTINTSIFVLDENDNDPELKFPSELNNMVHIANDLPIGKEVTRIDAFDPDEGDNAKLSYSCPRGNEEHYFVLNKTTGQLLVNKNLGSFDYYHFTLAVMVQDQGTPTHTVSGELHVIVNRSLAVIHFHKASGFSFLNIENHHLIVGTVVIVLLVVILIVVIIIVRCRQRQATQGNKYNCRREAKKRDAARKDANGEWKPVPNYAVEAAPNGPVEKPRKNVKFHVDKDDLKEEREGLWPPPPPQIHDVHDGKVSHFPFQLHRGAQKERHESS